MKRLLALVLLASPALASELDVPLGAHAALTSKKAIHEIVVRDPSLVMVAVRDGAFSIEGKKSGVTALTVEYADGELERCLVVVGDGRNGRGMSAERVQSVKREPSAKELVSRAR